MDHRVFYEACERGDLKMVQLFCQNKPEHIDTPSSQGWTGLIMACYNEHLEVVKFLVNAGSNINATNTNGTTVFMYAKTPVQAHQKDFSILQFLLNHGANINALDSKGKTVLDYVANNNAPIVLDWLKKHGAKKAQDL